MLFASAGSMYALVLNSGVDDGQDYLNMRDWNKTQFQVTAAGQPDESEVNIRHLRDFPVTVELTV